MDAGLNASLECKLINGLNCSFSTSDYGAEEVAALGPFSVWAFIDSYGTRIVMWSIVLPWCLSTATLVFFFLSRMLPEFVQGRTLLRRLPQSAWIIHGKKYDLSAWVKDHPGGERAIELGRNRDCTGLFESYHIFADRAKLEKILAQFEIRDEAAPEVVADDVWAEAVGTRGGPRPGEASAAEVKSKANPTGLVFNDAFHEDVKELVTSHYQKSGCKKMKTWVGCFMVLLVCAEVYVAYMFLKGSTIAVFLLPTIGWMLCSNLAHDGSHFAVSERPWINMLASYAGMPLFFNATCWHIQHVVQHHVYTNDENDVDLYHFLPVCRTSRFTKWASQYHFQWLAIFFVLPTSVGHLIYIVPLDLLTKQVDLMTGKRRYSECQNLEDFVARNSLQMVAELSSALIFFVVNVYFQGFVEGLRRMFMVYSIASFWFIVITQGAHLQQECMVGKEDKYQSWAKRQSATSVNFRPDSYFWLLFTGALNMQSLHHVVPCVGSSQLIDIYPEYKELCTKHGVPLKEVKSLLEFFKGFLGWIRELAHNEDEAQQRQLQHERH